MREAGYRLKFYFRRIQGNIFSGESTLRYFDPQNFFLVSLTSFTARLQLSFVANMGSDSFPSFCLIVKRCACAKFKPKCSLSVSRHAPSAFNSFFTWPELLPLPLSSHGLISSGEKSRSQFSKHFKIVDILCRHSILNPTTS